MYKVMVIEDDFNISRIIGESLVKENFEVRRIDDFSKIMQEFIAFSPELILLDINLPGENGFYWCKKIRELSKVPIVFISARNADMDIIKATNMGGDDYLVKPFSIELLIAKVKGMLRRTYAYSDVGINVMSFNGLVLNCDNGMVSYGDKQEELTHNEKGILKLLIKNQGKSVSRERIMRALWEDERFVDDNTLTVNITRLRKKLNDIGCSEIIKTVRNEGYRI